MRESNASSSAALEAQLEAQQEFARRWRGQLEDLRFAHAEAEAELFSVHGAERNSLSAELSLLESESMALRRVAAASLEAELKSRSLGSPAAMGYRRGSKDDSPMRRHVKLGEDGGGGASPRVSPMHKQPQWPSPPTKAERPRAATFVPSDRESMGRAPSMGGLLKSRILASCQQGPREALGSVPPRSGDGSAYLAIKRDAKRMDYARLKQMMAQQASEYM